MRTILYSEIVENIKEMCIEANCHLNTDICDGLKAARESEVSKNGISVLSQIIENAQIAADEKMPICQDTGMVIAFLKIGQDVHVEGGLLEDAVNEGVRQGYETGYMRKSVVGDPLLRVNTKDNTPAVVYYEIVAGEEFEICIMPKGFGSENMGGVCMLKPSQGVEGVIDFVVNTVNNAGPNPCPPIVVGVGIGGTMDKAAVLSKKALMRDIDTHNDDKYIAELENILLEKINELGIGPAGLGGKNTALGVNVETYPTHIAGLPVAVTISCHVTRHVSRKI